MQQNVFKIGKSHSISAKSAQISAHSSLKLSQRKISHKMQRRRSSVSRIDMYESINYLATFYSPYTRITYAVNTAVAVGAING